MNATKGRRTCKFFPLSHLFSSNASFTRQRKSLKCAFQARYTGPNQNHTTMPTAQWRHHHLLGGRAVCLYLLSCQMCFIQLLYGEEIPPQPEPSAIMSFGTSELVTGVQSPRWCRWVNWFSALRSPIRPESTQEEEECCKILLEFPDLKSV